jgi:tRNA-uridine 2-sulfurtransferase|uniref:tRNA-specific 2-thiouridylase MnmA n=1 Tax=viral metagenome TaxID=1070528 RepID=A0A6C0IZG9_9ZZZZ
MSAPDLHHRSTFSLIPHGSSVLVALSGGRDSAYVANLLNSQIRISKVVGVFFRTKTTTDSDVSQVTNVASRIGLGLIIVDASEMFDILVHDIEDALEAFQMPNICGICNKKIKFGWLLDFALRSGYDYIATGHYIKLLSTEYSVVIGKPVDPTKDQSYFLAQVPKEKLKYILCPLGYETKKYITSVLEHTEIPIAKESMDICFIKRPLTFSRYFARRITCTGGEIVSPTGKHIGSHDGVELYPIGKKLHGKYIVEKKHDGTIVVGTEDDLLSDIIRIGDINSFIDLDEIGYDTSVGAFRSPDELSPDEKTEEILYAKVRSGGGMIECVLIADGDGFCVTLEKSIIPPDKGQFCVIYWKDLLVLGGVVR